MLPRPAPVLLSATQLRPPPLLLLPPAVRLPPRLSWPLELLTSAHHLGAALRVQLMQLLLLVAVPGLSPGTSSQWI